MGENKPKSDGQGKPAQLVAPPRLCEICSLGLPAGRYHLGMGACVEDLRGVIVTLMKERQQVTRALKNTQLDLRGAERLLWLVLKLRGGEARMAPEVIRAAPDAPRVMMKMEKDGSVHLEALPPELGKA